MSPNSLLGVALLAAVLLAATVFGLVRRRFEGRVRTASRADAVRLAGTELGDELGRTATLVQFSTAFCQPCRATRRILAEVEQLLDGVRHVEIDAESHLDLVRRLGITRTPTVLVLDASGVVVRRVVGLPRKADVVAAVGELV